MYKTGFGRNVLTLLGGTSVGLAIPLMFSPVIARLYQPESFGQMAFFMSATSIGAVAATGRYELAIMLPRHPVSAFSLAAMALALGIISSIGFSVVCAGLWMWAPHALGSTLHPLHWIVLVPIGIALLSGNQTFTYWQTRQQQYLRVAQSRALQAAAMTSTQTVLGLFGLHALGLIIGNLVGVASGLTRLASGAVRGMKQLSLRWSRRRMCAAVRHYADIPRFMVAGHLANIISSQMPVLVLAALYGPKYAGLYALAERVSVVPCGVIGNSVGEVYRQEASREYQKTGNCLNLFLRTQKKLIAIGALLATTLFIAAPSAFPIIFGETWRLAGDIAAILSIVVFFQLMSSPMSQTVLFASMYCADLLWQIARLILAGASLYAGFALYGDFKMSILFYAVAFAFVYLAHSLLQYIAARGKHSRDL